NCRQSPTSEPLPAYLASRTVAARLPRKSDQSSRDYCPVGQPGRQGEIAACAPGGSATPPLLERFPIGPWPAGAGDVTYWGRDVGGRRAASTVTSHPPRMLVRRHLCGRWGVDGGETVLGAMRGDGLHHPGPPRWRDPVGGGNDARCRASLPLL